MHYVSAVIASEPSDGGSKRGAHEPARSDAPQHRHLSQGGPSISAPYGPGTTAGLLCLLGIFSLVTAVEARRCESWSDVLRAWWVDPAVATLSFGLCIDYFDRQERRQCNCAPREGLSGQAGVLYWVFVTAWASFVPPPANIPDGVPSSPAAALYLLAEVVSGVVQYDALFYLLHWGMHAFGLRMHRLHHRYGGDARGAREMRARDVLTHSLPDGVLQIVTNICVQRSVLWGGAKSRLARAAHNVIVTSMLTESHTCAPEPRVARRWFVGVQRHRQHHAGSPYYQQFFGYLDDLRLHAEGRKILAPPACR